MWHAAILSRRLLRNEQIYNADIIKDAKSRHNINMKQNSLKSGEFNNTKVYNKILTKKS